MALFKKPRSTVVNILERRQSADSVNGLLIIQGRLVLTDAVLVRDADLSIWIYVDLERCKVRYLKATHQWVERKEATLADAADLEAVEESQQRGDFRRALAHYQ